jgi:hypothetical protein
MRLLQIGLATLLALETVVSLAVWGVLWTRYRRAGVPWHEALKRGRIDERNFVSGAEALLRVHARVGTALATTLIVVLLLAAIEGRLFGDRP